MNREIVLTCPRCAQPTAILEARRPSWAHISAFATVRWAEDGPRPIWEGLNAPPAVGAHYLLHVRHPFQASPDRAFWVLFQPVLSSLNGWLECPHELSSSCLVRCGLRAVVSKGAESAVIRIQAREVLAVPDIAARFALDSTGAAFGELADLARHTGNLHSARWGDLVYWEGTLESDIGAWVVCHINLDRQSVVLYGQWDAHQDVVYAGHRPLNAEERAFLRRHVG